VNAQYRKFESSANPNPQQDCRHTKCTPTPHADRQRTHIRTEHYNPHAHTLGTNVRVDGRCSRTHISGVWHNSPAASPVSHHHAVILGVCLQVQHRRIAPVLRCRWQTMQQDSCIPLHIEYQCPRVCCRFLYYVQVSYQCFCTNASDAWTFNLPAFAVFAYAIQSNIVFDGITVSVLPYRPSRRLVPL
jgi:hypothetical protein